MKNAEQVEAVAVSEADEAIAREAFSAILGDIASFAEYGSPSYRDGALRDLSIFLATHRTDAEKRAAEKIVAYIKSEAQRWKDAASLDQITKVRAAEVAALFGIAAAIERGEHTKGEKDHA